MISDIAAWLFALFIIDPLQSELRKRFDTANVAVAEVQQSRQCVESHAPRLLQRAGDEPGWAVTTVVGAATGWTAPVQLLDRNDPNCSALIRILDSNKDQGAEARL